MNKVYVNNNWPWQWPGKQKEPGFEKTASEG